MSWVHGSLAGLLLEHNTGDILLIVFAQAQLLEGSASDACDPAVAQFSWWFHPKTLIALLSSCAVSTR